MKNKLSLIFFILIFFVTEKLCAIDIERRRDQFNKQYGQLFVVFHILLLRIKLLLLYDLLSYFEDLLFFVTADSVLQQHADHPIRGRGFGPGLGGRPFKKQALEDDLEEKIALFMQEERSGRREQH